MKIALTVNNAFIGNTSGVNTFITHTKKLLSSLGYEVEVKTNLDGYKTDADLIICNCLESYQYSKNNNAKYVWCYNHIGDLAAIPHYVNEIDFPDIYVFEFLNEQLKNHYSYKNYVIHQGIADVFNSMNISNNVLPLPYIKETIVPPEEQNGIIIIAGDYKRKRIDVAIDLIPTDIPVTLLSNTKREVPSNWTVKTVPNEHITKEIAKHKMLFLPSSIEMYPYVLLESVPYTRCVLMDHIWNNTLPYDIISTGDELVSLYNTSYIPPFCINEYSTKTTSIWQEELQCLQKNLIA